jgi:protein-tyrosine phosphatase
LSWIGAERLGIGPLPTAARLPQLVDEGVTHVINCRSIPQTAVTGDLAVERDIFGADRVAHAPMWDFGHEQNPWRWSAAAHFGAEVLAGDPDTRLFIHCQQGRRRSVLMAYAVLRLRGYPAPDAGQLIRRHRAEAELVEAYLSSVERWLAAGAPYVGPLRTG